MSILFAISILALVALLWASVSIAHHIRRTRRPSDASDTLLLPELLHEALHPELLQSSDADAANVPLPNQEIFVETHSASSILAEDQPESSTQIARADISEELTIVAPLSHPPKFPPAAAPIPSRVDWAYFKEDMGDLTDPLPAHPRLRHRAR